MKPTKNSVFGKSFVYNLASYANIWAENGLLLLGGW